MSEIKFLLLLITYRNIPFMCFCLFSLKTSLSAWRCKKVVVQLNKNLLVLKIFTLFKSRFGLKSQNGNFLKTHPGPNGFSPSSWNALDFPHQRETRKIYIFGFCSEKSFISYQIIFSSWLILCLFYKCISYLRIISFIFLSLISRAMSRPSFCECKHWVHYWPRLC